MVLMVETRLAKENNGKGREEGEDGEEQRGMGEK